MSAGKRAEVPAAVRDIAQRIPIDRKDAPGVATRLVYDPRMQPVWKWLKQRAQEMHDRGELEFETCRSPGTIPTPSLGALRTPYRSSFLPEVLDTLSAARPSVRGVLRLRYHYSWREQPGGHARGY